MQQPAARNKDAPVRLDIRHLEMRTPDSYPFGQALPHAESVVHLGRSYDESTFEQLRTSAAEHERLSHPNLVQLLRVVDSKRSRRLDLFYEWVPQQLSTAIRALTQADLHDIRKALYALLDYLLDRGFIPSFEPQLIGLVNRRIVKVLLPLNCQVLQGSTNRADVLNSKREEANTFLNAVARGS